MGLGSALQRGGHRRKLLRRKLRFAAGTTGSVQPYHPAREKLFLPATGALAADAQRSGHLGLRLARLEHLGRTEAALL